MSNVFQSLGLLVLRISIKRTFNRNTNVVRISIVATCFPLRGKCRKQYVQANWIFRSVATLKSSETPFRAQRNGACQRPSNNAQYTVVLPPQPSGQLPRWGAKRLRRFPSSRKYLASPLGGSAEGNMCKRTGFLGAKRR